MCAGLNAARDTAQLLSDSVLEYDWKQVTSLSLTFLLCEMGEGG